MEGEGGGLIRVRGVQVVHQLPQRLCGEIGLWMGIGGRGNEEGVGGGRWGAGPYSVARTGRICEMWFC